MTSTIHRPDRTDTATRRGGRARRLLPLLALPLLTLLGGCNFVVLHPAGYVAEQQRNLVLAATGLMLLIIVPVIAFTLIFAWRYRASNQDAVYDPEWHHSTQLEVLIWTAPLMIIIALGALTWIGTHTLDPFRPLSKIDPKRDVPAGTVPLEVEAVAMDWKWLFLYPQYGIATVNELAAPVDRPIRFKITATDVMNTFYVPTLAGMVYAMPGMQTQLHAVINREGAYEGRSAHYSGAGFSNMFFKFHGLTTDKFDQWIAKAKAEGGELTQEAYLKLEEPSEAEPARFYKSYMKGLYDRIIGMCPRPDQMCVGEMAKIDAQGGATGTEAAENYARLRYDNRLAERGVEGPGATAPASGTAPHGQTQPQGMQPRPDMGNPDVRGQTTPPDATGQGSGGGRSGGIQIAPKQLNQ
ncbi:MULTISPECIES: ubiquinol oxidase subunit II [Methylobacterium]|uniref:ubiquinol oxidase subunit II n=1 Tax=Methylobacterium TaxID=407 RepID=UPI000360BF91|nr:MULTISPECIES: ubiquinol oxidase subunit II [Methylobacterium]MBN4095235.1 ubiquinol oxidase subunit II [Methylobacterium sp. OT2]UIN32391.1 ubiquinol oxidase subunit II [Methylobacterium oryzae]SEF88438.1 cytochrome bo3 quinol oxidase subunit 2 [Methylobacterium sp. 190mf]